MGSENSLKGRRKMPPLASRDFLNEWAARRLSRMTYFLICKQNPSVEDARLLSLSISISPRTLFDGMGRQWEMRVPVRPTLPVITKS